MLFIFQCCRSFHRELATRASSCMLQLQFEGPVLELKKHEEKMALGWHVRVVSHEFSHCKTCTSRRLRARQSTARRMAATRASGLSRVAEYRSIAARALALSLARVMKEKTRPQTEARWNAARGSRPNTHLTNGAGVFKAHHAVRR